MDFLVYSLFITPIITVLILTYINQNRLTLLRTIAISSANIIFIISLILQFKIDFNNEFFSYYKSISINDSFNICYSIGIDGFSYYLILLTTLLALICILVIWDIKYRLKEFIISLFIIEFLLINVFCTVDLLFFYIFFEAILIPMFLIIGIWGARERKVDAAYKFFFYTFIGSVSMLVAILYIHNTTGTTHLFQLFCFNYLKEIQIYIWSAFFIAFAVKVPMMPIHLWLPEAHTEAPTAGSVLLAGILLKLGTYGMIRFLIPLFPYATGYYTPVVFLMCVIAVIFTSMTALRQGDLKKAIAYSSVAHMNLVIIGLLTNTINGIKGATFLMVSHGVVSGALFIIIGVIYDRYKTRNIRYYGGLALVMPVFVSMFLIHILSNMGFPGTSGFIGEFLILLLAYNSNTLVSIIATIGVILSAAYSVWLYNRVCFGGLKKTYIKIFADTNEREFSILNVLSIFTLILGLYPNIILTTIDHSILKFVV